MFFHPEDGFLYIAVGDGGHPLTESRGYFWIGVTDDAQRIDRDLLSGLLRIDVDRRGGDISHPIRRQPRQGRTQGYFIPNDNPWLDPGGELLEEFFAIGLRNPHRATYDPGHAADLRGRRGRPPHRGGERRRARRQLPVELPRGERAARATRGRPRCAGASRARFTPSPTRPRDR